MSKILGIDPSLTGTGYVVVSNGKLVLKELVKTKPTGDDRVAEVERLMTIRDSFSLEGIDLVVMEGIAFMARNTTALVQLSALNYMIRERLVMRDKPFVIVAPTTLKKFITGKGVGPKDQMMMEVYKRYGVTLTDNNICDAYGLAMIGTALLDKKAKTTKFQKEVIDLLSTQLKNEKHEEE